MVRARYWNVLSRISWIGLDRGGFESQTARWSSFVPRQTVTTAGFADMLTSVFQIGGGGFDRQVVDMTDVKGNYQVSLNFYLIAMLRANNAIPVSTGVNSQDLGMGPKWKLFRLRIGQGTRLKLEPRKANVEQIIVNSASKVPTETRRIEGFICGNNGARINSGFVSCALWRSFQPLMM